MHRTTIMLPPELKTRANRRAREMGLSFGEFVRRCLAAQLSGVGGEQRAEDLLFADQEVFTGEAPTDLAEHHDRYLYGDEAR